MAVDTMIQQLETEINTFKSQYSKYTSEGVNSAGGKARKALMTAKKLVGALRKEILNEQKAKKAAAKKAEE